MVSYSIGVNFERSPMTPGFTLPSSPCLSPATGRFQLPDDLLPLRGLAIYLAPVANCECQDDEAIILELANKAIVSDAIAPQSGEVGRELFAVKPRVVRVFKVFEHPSLNHFLGVFVEFLELLVKASGCFNTPAHIPHSSHNSPMGRLL